MNMTVDPAPHLRRVGLIITIASLIAIATATLMPESSPAVESHFCLICGSVGTVDALLNVFLFLPLGVGLALSGAQARNAVIWMFALSAMIETAQFYVISGRDATIGDVLTNTLGGALGFGIIRYHALWLRPPIRVARNLALGWTTIWLIIQIISSYAFTLSLPLSQYYGQIARELGNFAVFPGTVLSARIDGVPIPNSVLNDSRMVERLLVGSATVAASVVPAKPTPKIAPIVRVADAQQREILLLAQDGDRFIFGVRTGAAVLRARRPFFALPDVFPVGLRRDSSSYDSLALTARYAASGVSIGAHGNSRSSGVVIPINASLGWTLWLPFQWLIEGTRAEHVISSIWVACLMIPFGYCAFHLREPSSPNRARSELAIALVCGAALLVAGLVLIPYVFGLSLAPFVDWVATLGGLLLGYSFGSVTARDWSTAARVSGAPDR
jgi:glycopeptide antibiotics resistance protein